MKAFFSGLGEDGWVWSSGRLGEVTNAESAVGAGFLVVHGAVLRGSIPFLWSNSSDGGSRGI